MAPRQKKVEEIVVEEVVVAQAQTQVVEAPKASGEVKLTNEQQTAFSGCASLSAQVRYLASLGYQRGPIAKFCSALHGKTVSYQHVRGILIRPLKKVEA